MNHLSANPYASPEVDATTSAERSRERQLLPLWIWLAIAVVASFLGTPADPTSLLVALANGLISFSVGVILGLPINMMIRLIPAVLWTFPAIALALVNGGSFFIIVALCYVVASIAIGFWASRRIINGRFWIILCFAAGYVLGSAVGILGTVTGAVLGAILAKRSLPKPNGGQAAVR